MALLRIALIDQNKSFRESMARLIRIRFPEVTVAPMGAGAGFDALLDAMEDFAPDVIIADMHTLSVNTRFFARKVKERLPHNLLVLMNGFDIPEYRQSAYECGADYCLQKDHATFDAIAGLILHLEERIAEGIAGEPLPPTAPL